LIYFRLYFGTVGVSHIHMLQNIKVKENFIN
jgi:hypothetical protein